MTVKSKLVESLLDYKFPTQEDISFLGGVNFKPLALDELLNLASLPYRDDRFQLLAYSVSLPSLRPYTDKGYLELIKLFHGGSIGEAIQRQRNIIDSSIRYLIIQTNLKSPLFMLREMKWLKGVDFLGSYGIFTIHALHGFRGDLLERVVTYVAQYSLESCNTFERLLIGLIQPDDSWQLVLAEINLFPFLKGYSKDIYLKCQVYKPLSFIKLIKGSMKHKEVPSQEFVTRFKVRRSLEHFKPPVLSSEMKRIEVNDQQAYTSNRVVGNLPEVIQMESCCNNIEICTCDRRLFIG